MGRLLINRFKSALWARRSLTLAAGFNRPLQDQNTQSHDASNETGLFGNPVLTGPNSFLELNKTVQVECNKLLKEAFSPKRDRKLAQVMDDLSNWICCSADLVECMRLLHPIDEFNAGADESMMHFTGLVESLNTLQPLYEAVRSVQGGKDTVPMDAVDERIIQLFVADFQASGIHLSADERSKFVELSQEIFESGAAFSRHAVGPSEVFKMDTPDFAQDYLKRIGMKTESVFYMTSAFSDSPDPEIRDWAYRQYYKSTKQQELNLKRLVSARRELAHLVGFDSYAERAQRFTLLGSAKVAEDFLEGLATSLKPLAEKELKLLSAKDEDIRICDLPYLSGRARASRFRVSLSDLRPYFSVGTVIEGLSDLLGDLYGISLQYEDCKPGELWDESVHKLAVIGESGKALGYIYCDLYDRAGKMGGDCHFTVRCAKLMPDGSYQLPIVVLSLSFRPQPNGTTLLSPPQVENLFHEMGHALHSMLGRTRYQHVSGTRCSTDFAEVPSNLMEKFFYDPRVMQKVAKRYADGGSIGSERIEGLRSAAHFMSATELLQQVWYSLFDLRLHSLDENYLRTNSTSDLFAETQKGFSPPLPLCFPDTAWHHRFSHLVSYGAKYYSYLVAKASAALIWQKLFANDPFSREKGLLWAGAQSFGGEKPTDEILKDVLGYKPEPGHLIEAICKEIESSSKI